MSQEQQLVRRISWHEVFGFSQLFKTWKMAIQHERITLALLAIGLTFLLGVGMDRLFIALDPQDVVMPQETWIAYVSGRADFKQTKQDWLKFRGDATGRLMSTDLPDTHSPPRPDTALNLLQQKYRSDFDKAMEQAQEAYTQQAQQAKSLPDDERAAALQRAGLESDARKQQALGEFIRQDNGLGAIRGGGILRSLLSWEGNCVSGAVQAVLRLNFTGGLREVVNSRGLDRPAGYQSRRFSNAPGQAMPSAAPGGMLESAAQPALPAYGLATYLYLMAWGLCWMAANYPVYSLIYMVLALAVWSIFGGAICRMAALHAAREEKLRMGAALRFSLGKFFSFFTAPVLPLLMIVFVGLLLALGGLVGSIPYFGEWALALLFFVALGLGMVIAFLAFGLGGGWPLMWPTIAVEGSDSFDAVSRSLHYVYARPFRYILYWGVAAVYGTICYLFVRLFAFVALLATHRWVGWSMRLAHREYYGPSAGKLDVMWAGPTFSDFHGPLQVEATAGSERAASMVLMFWIYLVSGVVLAFLASFIFSAATNIYYLLRRSVDATDLDDVYVEESSEDDLAAGLATAEVVSPDASAPQAPAPGGETSRATDAGQAPSRPQ
jgi:hypothetical protein